MPIEQDFWMQLHANLLGACPVDTRNMITHIELYETPTAYEIMVAAPYVTNPKYQQAQQQKAKAGKTPKKPKLGNYAGAVNYALKSPHKNWIEKQIQQTINIMNGRSQYLGEEQ